MGNEELYDRIEAYLSDQMTPEEAEAFRKEVTANPDLAAELALHQSVAEAVDESEEIDDLNHKISAILQKRKSKSLAVASKRRFILRFPLRIAAAITFLVIAGVAAYYYWNSGGNNPQALYAQFVDYPSSIYEEQNLRAEDAPNLESTLVQLDSLWQKADQFYKEGKNEAALRVLQQVEALEVQRLPQASSRLYYYRGILQAKSEQFLGALSSFEQVKTSYTEDAKWKSALILLRLDGRRAEAMLLIREISTSSTPRKADALRLLEALQRSR